MSFRVRFGRVWELLLYCLIFGQLASVTNIFVHCIRLYILKCDEERKFPDSSSYFCNRIKGYCADRHRACVLNMCELSNILVHNDELQ